MKRSLRFRLPGFRALCLCGALVMATSHALAASIWTVNNTSDATDSDIDCADVPRCNYAA